MLQIPKVAIMFLTQGPMPHEALWGRWLESITGLMPTLCLGNAVCAKGGLSVNLSGLANFELETHCGHDLVLFRQTQGLCRLNLRTHSDEVSEIWA